MRNTTLWAAAFFAVLLLLLTALSSFATQDNAPTTSQDQAQPSASADPAQAISDMSAAGQSPDELTVVLQLNDNGSSESSKPRQAAKPQYDPLIGLDRIRDIATRFLGVPYRWGGTTPAAFDCSGFTRYIYSKLGIQLPRTAREQFRAGQPVKAGKWKPGDLIFFDMMKGYISHVGMYLGGGMFIHASTPKKGVRIDKLSKSSYKRCYVGARRYATA
ncbi:MAG: C40 family peptidase [Armatimonadetes bacterium]|nr:C40 family peptidase [Armatimonadota bacterium]